MSDLQLYTRRGAFLLALLALGIFIALAISADNVSADTDIATDGFEDGDDGGTGLWEEDWFMSGDSDITGSGGPRTGSKHLRLRRATGYADRPADLDGQTNVHLQFWAKADSFESGEFAVVQISPDGTNWTVLNTWVDGDDDDEYQFFDFAVADGILTDEFWVAFDAEMSGSNDRLYIDDLKWVSVGPTPTPTPVPTAGAANITLDGEFNDWIGQANIDDIAGDANNVRGDLYELYWANHIDGDIVFWMISRYGTDGEPYDGTNGQTKNVKYTVWVDTDNDGNFNESGDREVRIKYNPKSSDSDVDVDVRAGTGGRWTQIAKNADYGDSDADGGTRVEFAVTWSDLNVAFGQPIRMFAESNRDDRIPDTGDVQWSPASILGTNVLIALIIAGAIALWWFKGRHIWRRG